MSTFTVVNHAEDFHEQFNEILEGTGKMFVIAEVKSEEETETDVDRIRLAETKIMESNRRNKETVTTARNELSAIQRLFEGQKNYSSRTAGASSAEEHNDKMNKATAERVHRMKSNTALERSVHNKQVELEKLQEELKDEEVDAADEVDVLNSEVLRVKLYRDFGFTPIEVNGVFSKVLVRSRNSQFARTIQIDSKNNDYFWANFLWDSLGA